jgi:esterase/lipase superfamily enzyme
LAIDPHDIGDSVDGMYYDNFYFNNPVDYMASEHAPMFFR